MSEEEKVSETINSRDDLVGIFKTVSVLGFTVVTGITLFTLVGFLLNHYLSTGSTGIAVCALVGAIFMFYWACKRISLIMDKLYNTRMASEKDKIQNDE